MTVTFLNRMPLAFLIDRPAVAALMLTFSRTTFEIGLSGRSDNDTGRFLAGGGQIADADVAEDRRGFVDGLSRVILEERIAPRDL